MLSILKRKVTELNKQIRLQLKDFSLLEKIEKDIKVLITQQRQEQQFSREQVYAVSSELIDCYLLLEEEIELNLDKNGGQGDYYDDEDEKDTMGNEFYLRTGCAAINLSNWMYNLSGSSSSSNGLVHSYNSNPIDYQWMTDSLAIMNVQLSQKIIVETQYNHQIRAKYIDFLIESTKTVESMLNRQPGDPREDWKEDLKLSNQVNIFETMISQRRVDISDCNKKDDLLGQIITLGRELHYSSNSVTQVNEIILQGLFTILETTPATNQHQTLLLIVNAIDSMPEILENTKETNQYKIHYLKMKLLGLLASKEEEQVFVVEKEIIELETELEKQEELQKNQDRSGNMSRNSLNIKNSIGNNQHKYRGNFKNICRTEQKNNHQQHSRDSRITQDTTFTQKSIDRVLFWLIVAVKKLYLFEDNTIKKQEQQQYLLDLIEQQSLEYLIPSNSLGCVLQELLGYGKDYYSLSFTILSRYCRVVTGIKKKNIGDLENQDLSQLVDLFCVVMDAISLNNDLKGQELEEIIGKYSECLKIIVAAVVTSVDKTLKGGSHKNNDVGSYFHEISSSIELMLSRGIKIIMQVTLRLSQLSQNTAFYGAEITELLLILHSNFCSFSTNNNGQNTNGTKNIFKLHQSIIIQELSCLGILCQLHAESKDFTSQNKNNINGFISPSATIQAQQQHFIKNLEDTQKNHNPSSIKWAFLPKILLMILKKEQIPKELFSKLILQLMSPANSSSYYNGRLSKNTPVRDSTHKKSHSYSKFHTLNTPNTLSLSPNKNQNLSREFEFSATQKKQYLNNQTNLPDSLHLESDSWRMLGIVALKTLLLDLGEYPQLLELYCVLIDQRFNEYLQFFLQNCMGYSSLEGSVSLSITTPIINKLALTVNNYSNSLKRDQGQMNLQDNNLLDTFLAELKGLFQIIERFININKAGSSESNSCTVSTQIESIPICVLINPCELIECDELLCQVINNLMEKELTVTCQLSYFRIQLSVLPFIILKNNINEQNNNITHPKDSPVPLDKLVKSYLEDNIPDESLGDILLSAYGHHVTLLQYFYSNYNNDNTWNHHSLSQLNHIADIIQMSLEKLLKRIEIDPVKVKNSTSNEDMNTLIECVEIPVTAQSSSEKSKMKQNFYVFYFIRQSILCKTAECLSLIEKCRLEFPEILLLFGQIARLNKQTQLLPIIAQHYLLFLSQNENSESFSFELLLDLIEALPEMQNAESSYPLLKSVFQRLIVDPKHMSSVHKRSLLFLLQELHDKIVVISPGSSFKEDVKGLIKSFTGK